MPAEPVPAATPAADLEWRVNGIRRGIPVLLLVCFVVVAAGPVVRHGSPRWFDLALVGVGLVGVVVSLVLAVITWRTVVTLAATGIEVRGGRRKFYPYAAIGRVHRARLTSGAVSLMLEHDRQARLPAPVAGLGTSAAQIDDAVDQIRRRLRS